MEQVLTNHLSLIFN